MTLKASLDALTTDATAWDGVSTKLGTAATVSQELYLSLMTFPQICSDIPLHATYEDLRSKVEGLLTGGKTETDKIADTLRQVRTDFESTDKSEAAKYKSIWDPKV